MNRAALKCFHLFGLSNGNNPLDTSKYHNLLEAARRDKPVSILKDVSKLLQVTSQLGL